MSDEKKVKASKVVMAKTLAKISLIEVPLFMLRRGLKQIKGKNALQNTGKIIVLDWDETICKVNTAEELLKAKYGNKLGHEKYEYFRGLVKQGKASLEEAMLLGAELLGAEAPRV